MKFTDVLYEPVVSVVPAEENSSVLVMEGVGFSESLTDFYQSTRRYVLQDGNICVQNVENLNFTLLKGFFF
jgi:hypothetical protein